MKTAVIDVGGGLRGVYAAGVFDLCMQNGITFDIGIGVSAGSANLASYFAGQRGRNYVFYMEYAQRKKYMGLGNFLRKKSYVDLDYVYSTLSNSDGENPLDYPSMQKNPAELFVVASNALTGEAKYFTKSDIEQDNYDVFKASSSLPVVCQPYMIDGDPYYDGALSDPVPVEKALDLGAEKFVLILTRPREHSRSPERDVRLAHILAKKYPHAAEGLELRAERYNAGVKLAEQFESEGKALIIAPDDLCGMSTLTRDKSALQKFYDKGLADGEKIISFLE